MGKFDTFHCSVVVVKDLFFDTANGRGFLHDQMSLPVEEHMALHTGGASYFKFQGLLAANLRDTHNRQRHFFLLWVDEARVVILGGRFQLHPIRTDQRAELAGGVPVPCGLAVIRLNQVLVAHEQFHVVAVRQFGIEGVGAGLSLAGREGAFQR